MTVNSPFFIQTQKFYYIISVRLVNLSWKNFHITTWFRRRNFNIVGFPAFKNAYSYTVGVEFSFFNAQPM